MTGKMGKENRNSAYLSIRNVKDLQHQRRILSSRIDHQEIMVMYKLRNLWDFISPANLLDMGCRAIASHSRPFGVFYQAVSFLRLFLTGKRKK